MTGPFRRSCALLFVFLVLHCAEGLGQTPVAYRISFPEREHRWMQVEATFTDVPAGPLELRMSRSSPGRYALHEFAKNVFDVRITDPSGRPLAVTRPNPHRWDVSGHTGAVRVRYRVFGDTVDGTYLAIDSTHAHINMPAALMWARGFERHPATVRFEPPPGASWRAASQLLPGQDPFSFTAPNLQYLMDSPVELSVFELRTFTVTDDVRTPVVRVAVHHTGTDAEVDALARDIQSIVREARHVFREYPAFEGNTYTFIADYLPWAAGDAMEHRNSTVLTSSSSIRAARLDLLDTVAHEFFHAWNVERIRPRALEPFDFDEVNMSGDLWFAEGFTSYYAPLVMVRTGLTSVADFAAEMGRVINDVLTSPARLIRSAVGMSELAAFVDAAVSIDRTSHDNTYLSYYTWGEAIALGLDLALRDRSAGKVTLDDYMRALWERHGRQTGGAGYVHNPYTRDDLRAVLGEVSGDQGFADEFFARYVEGREAVDYGRLLARAGLLLRPTAPGRASAGALVLEGGAGGVRIASGVPFGSPAYQAGLERDDVILSLGSMRVTTPLDVDRVVSMRKPGDPLTVTFDRRGQAVSSVIQLIEDPRTEVVPVERAERPLTDAERRFRDGWLNSAAR
jgi:predicted metalloprotease with PDZ domain